MFYKMIVILIMLPTLGQATSDNNETIEWKTFLNEERNISINVDLAMNNAAHRASAINIAFRTYVSAFRSRNTTLPFSLMLNPAKYVLTDANSTITLDYVHTKNKDAVFEVHLECLLFKEVHHCTAQYTGSWPLWLVLLSILVIIVLFLALITFSCFYTCNKNRMFPGDGPIDLPMLPEPRRIVIPVVNDERISLHSEESGYESPN